MNSYSPKWGTEDHIHEDCLTAITVSNDSLRVEKDHGQDDKKCVELPLSKISRIKIYSGQSIGRGRVRMIAFTYFEEANGNIAKDIFCYLPSKRDPQLSQLIKQVTHASAIEIEDGDFELYRYMLIILAGVIVLTGLFALIHFA